MQPLTRLFNYSKKYKLDIYLACVYSILNKLFDILPEVLIGVAVDIIVNRQHSILAKIGVIDIKLQVITLGIITAITWVLESVFQYLYSLKWCFLAQNIQHDLRIDTYRHTQNLELEYFENKATGNIMSILNDDINQLERFINDGINQIIQIAASTILIASIFFMISPKIAVLSFIPIPLIFLSSLYFKQKLATRYLNMRNQAGNLNSKLNNNLSGISTIKSFVSEKHEINALTKISNAYKEANKHAIILSAAVTPSIRMIVMLGFLVALIYGGMLTIDGQIQVASYSILIFLSQRLLWPLTYLSMVIDTYQRSMASVRRVMGLLDTPVTIENGYKQLPPESPGAIYFDNVDFTYSKRSKLFNQLTFSINPKKTTAFVGSTGSGKSTIVKLLLRFYDVKSGAILIDGNNIKDLTLESLRNKIGLVSQDTFLVDDNIANNIAYGSFNATLEQIIEAAKIAGIHNFTMTLPDGYQTLIGEQGQKLSGGQKQRIALARAIVKNPDILILDEATSSLDNKTEAEIQASLNEVSKNRTTIIIAHRLSTIVNADIIYVLKHGQIIESGTHEELITKNGEYATLWKLQLHEIKTTN